MSEQVIGRLHAWLKTHEHELLNDTLAMLRVPSIEQARADNAPFGVPCRDALDLALAMGAKAGMRTTDLDGYVGYAEFGDGRPQVASFGHLDVVPVSDGWKHEPFGAEIDEGYIYSRGSVDDKGPTMASFYALWAIKECCPELEVRFRQVFGCNEESGFECLKRYNKTEEPPTLGVAPDSGWPLYHAEKGIGNITLDIDPNTGGEMELVSLVGGSRPNIVIDAAEAVVQVADAARKHVEGRLADAWDRNVSVSWSGDLLTITAKGKAAHGSTPFLGDSAATRAMRLLFEIAPVSDETYYEDLLQTADPSGAGIGVSGSDGASKNLTCNLGVASMEGGKMRLLFNLRYPVTWKWGDIQSSCEAHISKLKPAMRVVATSDSKPLYFPLEHPLVKIVVDAYKAETGEDKAPGVMGGGTYARAVPNTVSIGTGWEGDGKAHENDERLKVEHLFKMSRIYARILYQLGVKAAQMQQK